MGYIFPSEQCGNNEWGGEQVDGNEGRGGGPSRMIHKEEEEDAIGGMICDSRKAGKRSNSTEES